MRRFIPAVIASNTARRHVAAIPHDQAFATLLLPNPGALTWTVQDRIVAEFMPLNVPLNFAIIKWPSTPLPLYVRANGTRYALNTDFTNGPSCWAIPYAGQVLTTEAVFEYWSCGTIPGGVTPGNITLTISPRKQLAWSDTAGDSYTATPYSNYGRPYPVSLPISLIP